MSAAPILSTNFDKAMTALAKLGLIKSNTPDTLNAVLPLIQRIEILDPENALLIARIMQQSSAFNEIVRTHISSIEIGTRFITISSEFDSIRDDTRDMVLWMEDGKLDWREKAKMSWMQLRRGTVSDRFDKIQVTFADVMKSTNEQISTEEQILTAYQDFRFSIKEAESAAYKIVEKATTEWDAKKAELQAASDKVAAAQSPSEKSSLELARDQLINQVQIAESLYQIAKDLAENLKVSYHTSEIVFARLQQNIAMKRRIYEQSVAFFATNETVFTGLSAAFTSTQGLSESTKALEELKNGVNQSLEVLADLGNTQLEASARAGYGKTIEASSVARLAEAIIEYQSSMNTLVTQLREEATANANEIESATNSAKTRFVELVNKAQ